MIKKLLNISKKYRSNETKRKMGFTVLESIVAISVLSLSISGVFAVVQQSLSQAIISKDEVTAYYLAQEAIEVVKNKRDSNQLYRIQNGVSSKSWLDGLTTGVSPSCRVGMTCKIHSPSLEITECGASWDSCENVRQNPTTFLFGHDASWTSTNFKRELQIETVNADEIALTVQVSWSKGGATRSFKIKTHLFNWYE